MNSWTTRARKRLSRRFIVLFTRVISSCARVLPYRFAVASGGLLGFIAYYLLARERTRAITHLSLVFPARGASWARQVAHRTFSHLGKAMLEALTIDAGRLSSVVTLRGFENLQAAMDQGKGVVYMTGHVGNWELMADAVARHFPVSVVAAPLEPEAVNDMIVRLRARMGVKTIVRNRSGAARELIRVFRENRILGILIDQDTDVEGVFVEFMGRPAWTPTAAAQMAIKFGAPVVFGYARRERDNSHTVVLEGPLKLFRTGNDEEDIRTNTAMFTNMIENAILQNPEQWVWMHRRWRRQP